MGGTGLTDLGFNVAGSLFTDDRDVDSGPGPFDINVATPFNDTGSNTNVLAAGGTQAHRFRLNPTGSTTNVLAAGGTQGNLLRPSLHSTPGLNSTSNLRGTSPGGAVLKSINQLQSSAKKFGDQLQSSAKKFGDQLQSSAKEFSDQLQSSAKESGDSVNATRAGAKADTASSSEGDNGK